MKRSSRSRLHPGLAFHFPSENVHDRIGRAVCEARCLARKEFFESWSFVHRVRRHLDAPVVWDLCSGHGLVAFLLALLEPGVEKVRCVDRRRPRNHDRLRAALSTIDAGRVAKVVFDEMEVEDLEPPSERVFVTAVHACGRRTDRAIDLALAARASIAALPCCHESAYLIERGELPEALLARISKRDAVDAARMFKLARAGYDVRSRKVDDDVTAQADLILGLAPATSRPAPGPSPGP